MEKLCVLTKGRLIKAEWIRSEAARMGALVDIKIDGVWYHGLEVIEVRESRARHMRTEEPLAPRQSDNAFRDGRTFQGKSWRK